MSKDCRKKQAFKSRSLSCIMCITPGRHACRPFPDVITFRVACGMRTRAGVAPDAHGADYFRESVILAEQGSSNSCQNDLGIVHSRVYDQLSTLGKIISCGSQGSSSGFALGTISSMGHIPDIGTV